MKSLTQGHTHPGSDNVQIFLQSHKAMLLTCRCFLPGFYSQKCLKSWDAPFWFRSISVCLCSRCVSFFRFHKRKAETQGEQGLTQGPSIAYGLGNHLSKCHRIKGHLTPHDSTPGGREAGNKLAFWPERPEVYMGYRGAWKCVKSCPSPQDSISLLPLWIGNVLIPLGISRTLGEPKAESSV